MGEGTQTVDFVATIPPALAGHPFTVRLQTEADLPFIEHLYVSHRWEEMQAAPWTDDMRLAFLKDQFRGQWHHYSTAYFDSLFLIAEVNGEAVGRLYLFDQHPEDLRIVDIGFTEAWRGRGLGGALLRLVQDYAAAKGKYCSIHVEQTNPARRLYNRLGFREIKPVGPYVLLEWRPS